MCRSEVTEREIPAAREELVRVRAPRTRPAPLRRIRLEHDVRDVERNDHGKPELLGHPLRTPDVRCEANKDDAGIAHLLAVLRVLHSRQVRVDVTGREWALARLPWHFPHKGDAHAFENIADFALRIHRKVIVPVDARRESRDGQGGLRGSVACTKTGILVRDDQLTVADVALR